MIRATRRSILAGALAVPTIAGLASWRWRHGERSLLVHDPALEAGRRFAAAGQTRGGEVLAIEGDRIRFARSALERQPALIAGVSRHADALLIEDVAREAGYRRVAVLRGNAGRCEGHDCEAGWGSLGSMARGAGSGWVEALAEYGVQPGQTGQLAAARLPAPADAGLVLGWVLTPSA